MSRLLSYVARASAVLPVHLLVVGAALFALAACEAGAPGGVIPEGGVCSPGSATSAGDGCNSCVCDDAGQWACTEKPCAGDVDPAECEQGDEKQADDGDEPAALQMGLGAMGGDDSSSEDDSDDSEDDSDDEESSDEEPPPPAITPGSMKRASGAGGGSAAKNPR